MSPISESIKRLPATIAIPAVTQFTAKNHFVVDASEKAAVKIIYLGPNFRKHFLPKVENRRVAAGELVVRKLLKSVSDTVIIVHLGGEVKVRITLGQYFSAFAKQPNGENGELITSGYANTGYAPDIRNVLWAIRGRWLDDKDMRFGWHFEAHTPDDSRGWRADHQILSRL